jgi:hypothetical protein
MVAGSWSRVSRSANQCWQGVPMGWVFLNTPRLALYRTYLYLYGSRSGARVLGLYFTWVPCYADPA